MKNIQENEENYFGIAKSLKDILPYIPYLSLIGKDDILISDITIDSRTCRNGTMFVAYKGLSSDGHDYITKAISAGARVILCEKFPDKADPNVTFVLVKNPRGLLPKIANIFYDYPSQDINLIGVTGTNGKTSIVYSLYQLFRKFDFKVGMLSTIENKIEDLVFKSCLTTPDIFTINKFLRMMVDKGCEYCFMEVSSHAISLDRIAGLRYRGGVFTNLTHDHLDYHGTFKNYRDTKKIFFDNLDANAFAVYNHDDRNGRFMIQNTKALTKGYSISSHSDFTGRVIENTIDGLEIEIDTTRFWTHFVGEYNAYNLLAVYSVGILCGIDKKEIGLKLSEINPPPGRMQVFKSKDYKYAITDYAHTPDAIQKVLATITNILRKRSRNYQALADKSSSISQKKPDQIYPRIITVFGCGGDRDKSKRAQMGKVAFEYSDIIILTNDNPRNEDPEKIIEDILPRDPNKPHYIITDRKEAIAKAFELAQPHDVILVLGKGHEEYQIIGSKTQFFSDQKVIASLIKELD